MSRNIEDLFEWVTSDCVVVECIDGIIPKPEDGSTRIYKCPKCDRAVQKLRVFEGPVHLRSPEDMKKRLEERRDLYMNPEMRKARALEIIREMGVIFQKAGEKNEREKGQVLQAGGGKGESERVRTTVERSDNGLDRSATVLPKTEESDAEPPDSYYEEGVNV